MNGAYIRYMCRGPHTFFKGCVRLTCKKIILDKVSFLTSQPSKMTSCKQNLFRTNSKALCMNANIWPRPNIQSLNLCTKSTSWMVLMLRRESFAAPLQLNVAPLVEWKVTFYATQKHNHNRNDNNIIWESENLRKESDMDWGS